MNQLLIVAPDIFPGDAVGNYCLGLVRSAKRLGLEALAYAQRYSGDVLPIEKLFDDIGSKDTLLVSYSIYDPLLERLLDLPGRKICYFHGVTPSELLRKFEPITADLCAMSVDQFPLLKEFDLLMANSRYTADTLTEYVCSDDIKIVPPISVDMPIFQCDSFPRKSPDHVLTILVVGRVAPHKNVEDAIEILFLVRQQGLDARLWIVGSVQNNGYSVFLKQRAFELGVGGHVDFLGVLDDADLLDHFQQASLLLSVSGHEGFCIPVLEAMYLGLPVFVCSGTAASEVGAGAAVEFSLLDEACSEICEMYTNDQIRMKLIGACRSRAYEVLTQADDTILHSILRSS